MLRQFMTLKAIATDMSYYSLVSEARKRALDQWIRQRVDSDLLWTYTSLGMFDLLRREIPRLRVSHAQFKAAMLMAGFTPCDAEPDEWIFNTQVSNHRSQ
jgi:hypothetical protein